MPSHNDNKSPLYHAIHIPNSPPTEPPPPPLPLVKLTKYIRPTLCSCSLSLSLCPPRVGHFPIIIFCIARRKKQNASKTTKGTRAVIAHTCMQWGLIYCIHLFQSLLLLLLFCLASTRGNALCVSVTRSCCQKQRLLLCSRRLPCNKILGCKFAEWCMTNCHPLLNNNNKVITGQPVIPFIHSHSHPDPKSYPNPR